MAVWTNGLTRYGLYYAGIVDESQLDEVLELHKRDTVSTFGTRNSRRVTKKGATKHKLQMSVQLSLVMISQRVIKQRVTTQ